MNGSTIVARLTPPGPGALSSFAVLGPDAVAVVGKLFQKAGEGGLDSGRPVYGAFGADVRDDVVVSFAEESPEPCVEVCCHGGSAMTVRLIADLTAQGAELVDWRLLQRRAGRSEFQCDAIVALSQATTSKTAAILLDQLNGALDRAELEAKADPCKASEALRWSSIGRLLVRPARVILFGLPDVGKSSLFNALAGFSRTITAAAPGTTRDVVYESISVDGWPVELVDGAGFRDDVSQLEAEGLRRLAILLGTADLRVLVVDASAPVGGAAALAEEFPPHLVVANKDDLTDGSRLFDQEIRCSALVGTGLKELRAAIAGALVPEEPPPGAAVPFLERHREYFSDALRRCAASVSPR